MNLASWFSRLGLLYVYLQCTYIVSIFSKETTFFVETFNMFQQFLCHCQLEYYTKYKVNFRLIVLGCTAAEVQSEFYYCSTKNSLIGLGPKYRLMPGSLRAKYGRLGKIYPKGYHTRREIDINDFLKIIVVLSHTISIIYGTRRWRDLINHCHCRSVFLCFLLCRQ